MAYTTIKKPSDYFNTVLYTGNVGTNNITGVGFKPDLVWTKNRQDNYNHSLFDVVRGVTKRITANETNVEATVSASLTAFDSDGFSLGNDTTANASNNYASWNWKANSTGVANTDGSISSTVSANTTSGFSIVKWTGTGANATVGHGLGSVPKMIIVKNTTGSGWSWYTYHVSIGATKNLYLNNDDATVTSSDRWQDTTPTSSVFYLGSNGGVNGSGNTMIAYCFADVQGFSKFGSYIGNGSATDGAFCYTGFKPSFVIIKQTNAAGESWIIKDNKRGAFNQNNPTLFANLNSAESNREYIDFLSNGFKCRDNSSAFNASGSLYIFMAFAEQPLVGDNPATAR